VPPFATADVSSPAATSDDTGQPRGSKVLVTIATYNEIENLPPLVEAIFAELPGAHILVIDDNSPDGTGKWCDEKQDQDPRLQCLHRSAKLGLGTATIAGMRYAIEHGYQFCLNMDADFSHDPRSLGDLLGGMEPVEEPAVDVMVGSRYVPRGGISGWPLVRHVMSRGVNLYTRLLLGLSTRDCSSAFRCYRTPRLAELDFDAIRSRGYSFQEEVLWRLARNGARIAETPIFFENRRGGQSKISLREAITALWVIFALGMSRLWKRK